MTKCSLWLHWYLYDPYYNLLTFLVIFTEQNKNSYSLVQRCTDEALHLFVFNQRSSYFYDGFSSQGKSSQSQVKNILLKCVGRTLQQYRHASFWASYASWAHYALWVFIEKYWSLGHGLIKAAKKCNVVYRLHSFYTKICPLNISQIISVVH